MTTLHAYNPVVLENAIIYSDNIYFAKAALKIGAAEMYDSLKRHWESNIRFSFPDYIADAALLHFLFIPIIFTLQRQH